MRILIINTSERTGGAAVAAGRLVEALKNHGVKAKMLVRDKQTDRITTIALGGGWKQLRKFLWERLIIWMHSGFRRERLFSVDIANAGNDITRLPEFQEADLIHLHWVNQGMLSLKGIRKILASGKPIVWTMHDMWPCTGICHHARSCAAFQSTCGNCPMIYSEKQHDLSTRIFNKKQQLYDSGGIHFVTCSHWLEGMAKQSALLAHQPVSVIPNPIPTNLFRPLNRQETRQALQLPTEGKLLLFGSVKLTDKRKGIDYMVEACRLLAEQHPQLKEELGLLAVGMHAAELQPLVPFKVHNMGYVRDEQRLVQIYNAADLYVIPSLDENLPNTIMEAMACGIPCVGFPTGGIPEMIDHLHNGYLTQAQQADQLAEGIYTLLTTPDYSTLSRQAIAKVNSCYSESTVAHQYTTLYAQLLKKTL